MRWQRLSISECIKSGDWHAVLSRVMPSLGVTTSMLAVVALLLAFTPVLAESDEIVAGGQAAIDGEVPERGMPATNPRVKSILAAHPGELVTICVAGCGKPMIVQTLPKPIERRSASMRTTAGGDGVPARQPAYDAIDRDAVLCVAGCPGRSGQVVQQMPGLPPSKAAPRDIEEGRNEPLDIVR
jgi:hypothetical protein